MRGRSGAKHNRPVRTREDEGARGSWHDVGLGEVCEGGAWCCLNVRTITKHIDVLNIFVVLNLLFRVGV